MDDELKNQLMAKAREIVISDDPAHDFGHTLRVLANAQKIAVTQKKARLLTASDELRF